MKYLKRLFPAFLAVAMACSLCACGSSGGKTESSASGSSASDDTSNKKISVVCTNFPEYDFVRQIAGDTVKLTMLLKPGAESHSYEPTPQDIIKIQHSNLFIYVGGDSDAWVDKILSSMDQNDMKVFKLMDCVDLVEENSLRECRQNPQKKNPVQTPRKWMNMSGLHPPTPWKLFKS